MRRGGVYYLEIHYGGKETPRTFFTAGK